MTSNKPLGKRAGHSLLMVRLIATSKVLKSLCLLVVGIFILHTIRLDGNVASSLRELVNAIRLDQDNRLIHGILEKTLGISAARLRMIYTGTLIYSALYMTEGIGLFMDKGWAEWMAVITTAGFIPLEIYEIFERPSLIRIVVFLLNVAILVYLMLRIHWRYLERRQIENLTANPHMEPPGGPAAG